MSLATKQRRTGTGTQSLSLDIVGSVVARNDTRLSDYASKALREEDQAGADECFLRAQVANALTAILLHSDVIRRGTAASAGDAANIDHSAKHIARNVERLWELVGDTHSAPREPSAELG